ncbi:MAG: sulfatase [Caldilineaceae bacterium]
MRILYFDIDSLRPDHLGCYGYQRQTSPTIDSLAAEGIRFENVYISDAACMPSRTALFSGRFGVHTGAVNHGGVRSEAFPEGAGRNFRSTWAQSSWPAALRDAGLRTATISSFGERHAAYWWYAGFQEILSPGRLAQDEMADDTADLAVDWLQRHGEDDNWFLHVNFWDVHVPYRAPADFGDPFAREPLPDWYTEEVLALHLAHSYGPNSARHGIVWRNGRSHYEGAYPRQPVRFDDMTQARRMFDGYDTAIRYVDQAIERILHKLAALGILDDTAVIVSADHGENLGELNIYMDHATADHVTMHVPLIVRWPGLPQGHVDTALHYQVDLAATVIELAGGRVPANWDGESFAAELRNAAPRGRSHLVLSQLTHSCQRAVRFDDFIAIHSYHDAYRCLPDTLLFDVVADPHEQNDLAPQHPDLVQRAAVLLVAWERTMMQTATHPHDPLWTVLAEGGGFHARNALPSLIDWLDQQGQHTNAERMRARYLFTHQPSGA